ncbi:MAG TPA: hypothetical protein VMP68_10575, partial [Candidatus Eisenbacteria bacterium]|nr:hypothetical protein [Candidatus Eisenbacteria bacterium]
QVQRMPNQVVDHESMPAHPQRFGSKLPQLLWLQMMCEQTAADHIEGGIAEGKSESVGSQGSVSRAQVRRNTVEIGDVEGDATAGELKAGRTWNFAKSCGDLQESHALQTGYRRNPKDELPGGPNSAKPAINPAEVA